jgi:hypothetical protein
MVEQSDDQSEFFETLNKLDCWLGLTAEARTQSQCVINVHSVQ